MAYRHKHLTVIFLGLLPVLSFQPAEGQFRTSPSRPSPSLSRDLPYLSPSPYGSPSRLGPELGLEMELYTVAELYHSGRYVEATELAAGYVARAKETVGEEHGAYAAGASWLSMLYQAQGRYDEAEPLAVRALAIDEKRLGPTHRDIRPHLDNLAQLYQAQQRYVDAEQLYTRALAIAENTLGPEAARVGSALNNLAWLYQEQGRYAEAEPLIKRALAIVDKSVWPEHAEAGRFLDTLARLYEGQGRIDEAEQQYTRALKILEKALGSDHPELMIVRANLGGLYKSQDRLGEAEPLLKIALAAKEKVFGIDHPAMASSLTQLAELYRQQGQCVQAEPLFVRALAISKGGLQEVPVLFGTDRKRDNSQPSIAFGADRARNISLGLAIVTVPKEQRRLAELPQSRQIYKLPAELKAPNDRIGTDARRLALRCIEVVQDKELVDAAVRRLGVSKTFPGQVFVFVHGYNISFENAVRRAAQISYDLKFDGGTFLFSWPSRNRLLDYFSDRDTVDVTAEHLKDFLKSVVARTKATKIHFIAHSMGNMVLLRALETIGSEAPELSAAIGEIIHAAPDVDPDLFARVIKKIQASGAMLTLYASSSDRALWLSGWLRDRPRAGFISDGTPLIVAGVDTIDISSAGTGFFALNHDVYSDSPTIVRDMQRIIARGERPPDRRTKEFDTVVTKDGGTYWRLRQPSSVAAKEVRQ